MRLTLAPAWIFAISLCNLAVADSFGVGVNSFDIDFVTVGNPSNPTDITGNPNPAGAVTYTYRIAKFEISEQMIDKANAAGAVGITKDLRDPDKPATGVSWFEAAKFVNYLNAASGSVPAYNFDANGNFHLWTPSDPGYDSNNLYRNSLARYFLPSVDEWYKAAFYDPVNSLYYDYPTGSNTAPAPVASGTAPNTAVFGQPFAQGPADIYAAGGPSPYGTVGQGGNVWEFEETDFDLLNDAVISQRGLRGGHWASEATDWPSSLRSSDYPVNSDSNNGFRVASVAVPEPSALALALIALATLPSRRRKSVPHNCV